jgi:Flp pilus assembly pilin Flp
MKSIASLFRAFNDDDSGAAFIEYTALLGVILAVGIGVLTIVGNWANTRWNTLATQLNATP